MKRYEGLFILNTAGQEEGIQELIERISAEIKQAGGRVETIQKMGRHSFARVANRKVSSGFYVNFIFEAPPHAIAQLRNRFALTEEIFRVMFTVAPPAQAAA
ncbi:MAG: 30S ribosomal protein S6 [Verrucomicrobiota bacterium]|nr:30S ribosomal protein S6 [Limisphaera sp.]MDW8381850.1 30S ribosomal protein S6 [Verrucomicrobiota bacterium]